MMYYDIIVSDAHYSYAVMLNLIISYTGYRCGYKSLFSFQLPFSFFHSFSHLFCAVSPLDAKKDTALRRVFFLQIFRNTWMRKAAVTVSSSLWRSRSTPSFGVFQA